MPKHISQDRPPIRLVVSDLDGTLLDGQADLTEDARAAVAALRDAGIMFTFATGRMDPMTWAFASELDLDLPIISTNGALIRAQGEGKIYHQETMRDEDIDKLFSYGLEREMDVLIYTSGEAYHFPWSTRIAFFRNYNQKAEAKNEPLVPLIETTERPAAGEGWRGRVLKVFINYAEEEKDELFRFLEGFEHIEMQQSAAGTIDLNAVGCSKGRAVNWLSEHYQIPLEQICTIGDQENDLAMLELSGLSLAMGNAIPRVQAAADHVLPTHYEEGFAVGIRRHVLKQA